MKKITFLGLVCPVFIFNIGIANCMTVSILSPEDNGDFSVNEVIEFEASVGNVIGTPTYAWVSSKDGSLGTDLMISTTLTEGSHTITFIGTDDNGPVVAPTISLSINPVPIPGAIWFFGSGLICLITCKKAKRKNVLNVY